MIKWQKMEINSGATAEFPGEILNPHPMMLNKTYYWDQDTQQKAQIVEGEDYIMIPTFGLIDNDAKEKMESNLEGGYDYQFMEIVCGDKIGLMVVGDYIYPNILEHAG